jgi:hypothetical protein
MWRYWWRTNSLERNVLVGSVAPERKALPARSVSSSGLWRSRNPRVLLLLPSGATPLGDHPGTWLWWSCPRWRPSEMKAARPYGTVSPAPCCLSSSELRPFLRFGRTWGPGLHRCSRPGQTPPVLLHEEGWPSHGRCLTGCGTPGRGTPALRGLDATVVGTRGLAAICEALIVSASPGWGLSLRLLSDDGPGGWRGCVTSGPPLGPSAAGVGPCKSPRRSCQGCQAGRGLAKEYQATLSYAEHTLVALARTMPREAMTEAQETLFLSLQCSLVHSAALPATRCFGGETCSSSRWGVSPPPTWRGPCVPLLWAPL